MFHKHWTKLNITASLQQKNFMAADKVEDNYIGLTKSLDSNSGKVDNTRCNEPPSGRQFLCSLKRLIFRSNRYGEIIILTIDNTVLKTASVSSGLQFVHSDSVPV